jgi:ADP-heptose:LPS heptosyltransferase
MPEARILVIKLGAFGNVVLSLGAFGAIRQHHLSAEITVLTTAPYADWLAKSPYFDRVAIDLRPPGWDLAGILRLRRMLMEGRFDRVYDLQTSGRSSRYFRLFPRRARPQWSGIAVGSSHPDRNPRRDRIHDIDRQYDQLRQAGIVEIPPVDLSWSTADIGRFDLPRDFALLIPGSSPHRLGKRWPADKYRELAAELDGQGIASVVLGGASESGIAAEIGAAFDLTGRTGFGELTELARSARFAVGNDTGPTHLIATAGCPSVVLFSRDSDPELCAPRGVAVTVLRCPELADMAVEPVLQAVGALV